VHVIFGSQVTPPRSFDVGTCPDGFADIYCSGPIEANHAGIRIAGLGTKSKDCDVIPMCKGHHQQWTEYKGMFKKHTHEQRREYAAYAIKLTQDRAIALGVEVPDA